MKLKILIINIYIYLTLSNTIKNGVYNLITDNIYLYFNETKFYLSNEFYYPNTFYRINNYSFDVNETYYKIDEIQNKLTLSFSSKKELKFFRRNKNNNLWKFIKVNDNDYVIENKNNCYVKLHESKLYCYRIPIDKASHFNIIHIYSEVPENISLKNKEILNKEPIDVLIKYIDLTDPKLNRTNIHQIEKDYDNEELRYSIRSILTNIPWIRKIFILMPNERVRYFRESNFTKNKIIYVNDKDLLGHDSSNCNNFLFRYWKMKDFGISDNIIVMDDDYFILGKLNKSDFFYVQDGKVIPLIPTTKFLKVDIDSVKQNSELYEMKAKKSNVEQNTVSFFYRQWLTIFFCLSFFSNTKFKKDYYFIPKFTHNAIPVNLADIKEIYQLIYNSKYKYSTLECLYRHIESLQFQTFILSYTFIKYRRKAKNITRKFIKIDQTIDKYYNYSLICINKGAKNYSYLNLLTAKIVMEYLFPIPNPFEIEDNTLRNLSFNIVYSMNENIKRIKKTKKQYIKRYKKKILLYKFHLLFILFFLLVFFKNYYKN